MNAGTAQNGTIGAFVNVYVSDGYAKKLTKGFTVWQRVLIEKRRRK